MFSPTTKTGTGLNKRPARFVPWFVPVIGLATGCWFLGGMVLDPNNLVWLKGDLSQVYLGSTFFRQDPNWHWPLGFTFQLSYPVGCCISNTNSAPLVSVLCKLFSVLLPSPFQWLGLLGLMNSTLQIVFGYALCRRFASNPYLALAGSLFFLLTPAYLYRMGTDMVLSSQWLILFSLWIYFRDSDQPKLRPVSLHGLVLLLAGGLHPYLATFCALVVMAEMLRSILNTNKSRILSALPWTIPLALLACYWIIFGYVQFGGDAPRSSLGGYGDYSLNLLAPFDPNPHNLQVHSWFLPDQDCVPAQAGCYNYLGLGTLLLLLAGLLRRPGPGLDKKTFLPLWIMAAGCLLIAISNRVTFGHHVLFELPLPYHPFRAALSIFRGSDRFFWPVLYVLLLFCLNRMFQRPHALLWLSCLALLQLAEVERLKESVHASFIQPRVDVFQDKFWKTAGQKFQKLVVLPAWQARPLDSALPGGPNQWESLGFIATGQHMALNANYLARPVPLDDRMQCETFPDRVSRGDLDKDTLYLLDTSYLCEFIAKKFTHIESRYVDHQLVFWLGETRSPENLEALQARLQDVLADPVDFKQLARGFVVPTDPVPFTVGDGCRLDPGQKLISQGDESTIMILTGTNRVVKQVVLDLNPFVGGQVPEQKFEASLDGVKLGDYAITKPGLLKIVIPPALQLQIQSDHFGLLTFDWFTPISPDAVNPPATSGWTGLYRKMLSLLHVKTAPEYRFYSVEIRSLQLVSEPESN
jgi:hypothetical protein